MESKENNKISIPIKILDPNDNYHGSSVIPSDTEIQFTITCKKSDLFDEVKKLVESELNKDSKYEGWKYKNSDNISITFWNKGHDEGRSYDWLINKRKTVSDLIQADGMIFWKIELPIKQKSISPSLNTNNNSIPLTFKLNNTSEVQQQLTPKEKKSSNRNYWIGGGIGAVGIAVGITLTVTSVLFSILFFVGIGIGVIGLGFVVGPSCWTAYKNSNKNSNNHNIEPIMPVTENQISGEFVSQQTNKTHHDFPYPESQPPAPQILEDFKLFLRDKEANFNEYTLQNVADLLVSGRNDATNPLFNSFFESEYTMLNKDDSQEGLINSIKESKEVTFSASKK